MRKIRTARPRTTRRSPFTRFLLLAALGAGASAAQSAPVEGDQGTSAQPPLTDALDYGYTYWPGNHWYVWQQYQPVRHVRTGRYGLALNVTDLSLQRFGLIDEPTSEEAALREGNETIESLPAASLGYGVSVDGVMHVADEFLGDSVPSNPSRLIDMGRFMQRIEIPEVRYSSDPGLEGSVQLAAGNRHFVLTHRVRGTDAGADLVVRMDLGGAAVADYSETEFLDGPRAISVSDAEGDGWSFIIPEVPGATPTISRGKDGSLVFEADFGPVAPGELVALSVIAVPSNAGGPEQRTVWLDPTEAVRVEFDQMNRDGSGGRSLEEAAFDPERGVHVVQLSDLSEVGAPNWRDWANLDIHNWYNRHRLVVTNQTGVPVSVPIVFEGGNNAAFYIVGGSPMLRDLDGEPIGAPIQISKNWHETPFWYHLYTTLDFQPGAYECEHTFAHSRWGGAYAAAHAQLSLIGWQGVGRNQQWDESSLGAFGETITYDPDMTLGRAFVDDVRPFLVDAGGEWNWTGNVGGANFLVYKLAGSDAFPEHQLGRVRTRYRATGPNLTDVIYAGVTRDGAIEARIATQLGRTDDLVRVYYHLDYTFLEDVDYQRIAFFQIAADRYADNGFQRHAYGNADGVTFDEPILVHGTTGYASESDRGIPLEGAAPWVMLYDNARAEGNLPENLADIGFVVREYEATIGGVTTTQPHINIRRTLNGVWSQMAFELGIPYDPANTVIPAGSTFRATVEYLIPPADKSTYYGPSDYLLALAPESYRSTEMMLELAAGNELDVAVSEGTLLRTHPVEVALAEGGSGIGFELTGGRGYTPVTVHGLPRHDGWVLEQRQDGDWTVVDQSVEGNDFWQAVHDPESDAWSLTWNVHNRGAVEYRLLDPEAGTCPADLDGDGRVGPQDLTILLGAWRSSDHPADLNDDGTVDGIDLGVVLGAWGVCQG